MKSFSFSFFFLTTNDIILYNNCLNRACAFVCIPSGHSNLSFPSCLWLARRRLEFGCWLVLCYYCFSPTAVSSFLLLSFFLFFFFFFIFSSLGLSLSPPESTSGLCFCVSRRPEISFFYSCCYYCRAVAASTIATNNDENLVRFVAFMQRIPLTYACWSNIFLLSNNDDDPTSTSIFLLNFIRADQNHILLHYLYEI